MGGSDMSVLKDSSVIVITAGARQKPGQSRMDLAAQNASIMAKLVPQMLEQAPDAVLVMVTNPCDVLTVVAQQVSGLPVGRVLSTGTLLDTSRLRWAIAQRAGVSLSNVHAAMMGEHGDTEFALWSSATIAQIPIRDWTNPDGERVFSEQSLAQIATRDDRVCVLNILGGESSEVTPVGHAWSGGNVVFGTSPGKGGSHMPTNLGDIPVYNNVLEGLADGHRFNAGVVYLPPAAARHGVGELIRVNPEMRKIFIVTEKIPAHDAREIRAMAQSNGVDIFGANSLGVADSWNHIRIGGALGGNTPEEALRKGSIALLSNSGNFTTTIATYLRMAGWGTTTLISSGKDVYIHYAAPEFAFALANDMRSKAGVLYVEPGGYYELDAEFERTWPPVNAETKAGPAERTDPVVSRFVPRHGEEMDHPELRVFVHGGLFLRTRDYEERHADLPPFLVLGGAGIDGFEDGFEIRFTNPNRLHPGQPGGGKLTRANPCANSLHVDT